MGAGRYYMATMKRPNLKRALKKVDLSANDSFGKVKINLNELPCLKKMPKIKITANFDADVLQAVRKVADKNDISYSTLINDVLREVFIEKEKKAS
jgi:uncharacterized protein (DUF4415 family)